MELYSCVFLKCDTDIHFQVNYDYFKVIFSVFFFPKNTFKYVYKSLLCRPPAPLTQLIQMSWYIVLYNFSMFLYETQLQEQINTEHFGCQDQTFLHELSSFSQEQRSAAMIRISWHACSSNADMLQP